ncbi:hypothetical protein [Oligoflexus tunisiensis]|uniref:hypothetical protein n=1 Tax=Oligoflexus tunisiensis TaxID=708132 RepID=UPI00114CBF0E|nr:hypothetical protein [Oligoflexus tunisiensis]
MRIASLIGLLTLLLACSGEDKRPETADKLKPILVLVNPPAGASTPTAPLDASGWEAPVAGGTVTLQFHFIGPADMETLTLTPGEVELQPPTLPITNWTVAAAAPHDYPGLRHVTIDATASLPTAQELSTPLSTFDKEGFVRLRYTLVVSDGSRELPVVGDFIVYRDNTVPGASENLFGSTLDLPLPNEPVTDKVVKIASTLQNPQDEPVKIGWYVSEGEIKNRRAANTEWELPGSGDYTLIFTVRGKESRNGDIQIRSVSMP